VRTFLIVVVLAATVAGTAAVAGADRPVLGLTIAPFLLAGPGQVRIDVAVSGLQAELHPTIEERITVGSTVIDGPRGPAVAAHLPGVLDLRTGTFRLGGVAIFHFPAIPPLAENSPIAAEITVRQGNAAVTARRTGMLLLPTIIVPGYLNDLATQPDPDILSVLERRGYRAAGASPTVFWFTYPSRRFTLEAGARALAAYVRRTVLPAIYAARINMIGYSEGGLLVRWNLAFDPEWAHLINQFMMLGVPNEGAAATYVYGWYPAIAGIAATPAARDMFPTYPFWRATSELPWTFAANGRNPRLARLNAQPLPDDVQIFSFYGSGTRTTWAGVTGTLPNATFSYGPGDGVVLVASALGLPVYGAGGVPGLANRLIRVDVGDVRHLSLFRTVIPRVAALLAAQPADVTGRK
jgi:hypothetical protein